MSRLVATWFDRGREPKNPPDPRYPLGLDVDLSRGAHRACTVVVPYPAKRCGVWMIDCPACGLRAMVTTAGRADDPRSVTVACKDKKESLQ